LPNSEVVFVLGDAGMKLLGILLAASLSFSTFQTFAADMPKDRPGFNPVTYNYCRGSSKYRCKTDHNYGWGQKSFTHIGCRGASDQQIIASRCGGYGDVEYVASGLTGGMCGFDWFYLTCW
jgi:hypothetical protein